MPLNLCTKVKLESVECYLKIEAFRGFINKPVSKIKVIL